MTAPMPDFDIIQALQDRDDKRAYELSKELINLSASSPELYGLLDDFLKLLSHKSSFVRTRGFALCCAQARWDEQGKLAAALPVMLSALQNEKPTAVRGCIAALKDAVRLRPELGAELKKWAESFDTSMYKDSMAPLIDRDLISLLKLIDELN